MKIPLYSLLPQHSHLVDDMLGGVRLLLEDCDFINGQPVVDFEKAFAHYLGVRNAIAVKSGADALLLSLRGLDIMPGDDIIVPSFGPIESAEAVGRLYANPLFVDVDPQTYGLDPTILPQIVTEKTRAIIATHMEGSACTIDQIHQFAEANGLLVIEDASQSLGVTYMNKKLGTFGITGCFSFYPTLTLGAAGDGGMVVTDDDDLAERLRRLRDHGQSAQGTFDEVGMSSRMDSIQAIFLRLKLEEFDEALADRLENARLYERLLENAPVKRPRFLEGNQHVYCHYTVEHEQRDQLQAFLADRGIEARAYYATPTPMQPCFEFLEYGPGAFPVAEGLCKRVLSLPIYPGLKKRELEEVAAAVQEFFSVAA